MSRPRLRSLFQTGKTMRIAIILGVVLLKAAYADAASPDVGAAGSITAVLGQGCYHLGDTAHHLRITRVQRSSGDQDRIVVTVEIDPGFHINANPASFDYLIPTTLNVTD